MPEVERTLAEEQRFELSIIVAVRNDWTALDSCLRSIAEQAQAPRFEVLVIDDGSDETAPANIQQWTHCFPVTVLRQVHAGIAAARNRGIRESKGALLLFVDADCKLHANCLLTLSSAIARSPQHNYFQLRLTGNCSSVVGRAEQLRLAAFQEHMLQPDGRIRYLNTAGFAIRRTQAVPETGLFDPAALRGEDTLLLASLMQRGELPLFVPDAMVEHAIPLSLPACLLKDIRSAYLEAATYEIIAAKGISIRVTPRERLRLLSSMWKTASQQSIDRAAWFVLVGRQALQRMISVLYKLLHKPLRSKVTQHK